MTCDLAQQWFSLSLYGELSFDEEEQLEQHLNACGACARQLERERNLHLLMDTGEVQATPAMLASARQQLHRQLGTRPPHASWRERLQSLWQPMSFPFAIHVQPLAAVALVALGFVSARFLPSQLLGRVGVQSGYTSSGMLDPSVTRVRTIEPEAGKANGGGKVRIIVEETRQHVLSGSIHEEQIRQLLLSAARDTADPSVREQSMDALKEAPSSVEVRAALLSALQHDPNPGVRLNALDGLKSFAQDADVKHALAQVLLTDDNAGVRTQAVDLLTQKKEADLVGLYQQLLRKEDNLYVRQRCERALQDMNASTEIF